MLTPHREGPGMGLAPGSPGSCLQPAPLAGFGKAI